MFFLITFLGFCSERNAVNETRGLHVSVKGSDENDGSKEKPFLTIMAAVRVAQPGDVITVYGN